MNLCDKLGYEANMQDKIWHSAGANDQFHN